MRSRALSASGKIASAFLAAVTIGSCSSDDTDPFSKRARGGESGLGGSDAGGGGNGGTSGANTGGAIGGSGGASSGGDGNGGTSSGGATGEGGAGADAGTDTGGTATGGDSGRGGQSGSAAGGAGMGGAGTAGAGTAGVGAGNAGSGGMPGGCSDDGDCDDDEYCKKATCDAATGACQARGPACSGATAEFEPVCGCDGITYWNTCVIEHEGFNVAQKGECTGANRPTCTRDEGGSVCPSRGHVHCYRPVEMCSTTSPTTGVCWVLPDECPPDEPQTTRYCGGTAGEARCIGLCEVIDAENSFQRNGPQCVD